MKELVERAVEPSQESKEVWTEAGTWFLVEGDPDGEAREDQRGRLSASTAY